MCACAGRHMLACVQAFCGSPSPQLVYMMRYIYIYIYIFERRSPVSMVQEIHLVPRCLSQVVRHRGQSPGRTLHEGENRVRFSALQMRNCHRRHEYSAGQSEDLSPFVSYNCSTPSSSCDDVDLSTLLSMHLLVADGPYAGRASFLFLFAN